jgi:Rhodopirellula transposase DDE domain
LSLIRPYLDERSWRLLLGAEAKSLGRGGIKVVAAAAAVHPDTVAQGVRELDVGEPIPGRVRRPGAGRPPMVLGDPDLLAALDALVDPVTRGDPESPLRWTTKSTAKLAAQLTAQGHRVSARTVAKLLKEAGYSLQANSKTLEGNQHPDRDAQFGYLNAHVQRFQAAGAPAISVDTKKKELIGNYRAAGREWEPAGSPRPVKVHDFADKALGKVAPYGVYDIAANTGWVNVGTDADTGAFAVESIRRWWTTMGAISYRGSDKLLITADSGGSNGSRLRLWKTELAAFATETGLDITVCHLPPGTSKWNKIEHRLFSAISRNWRGRPLQSHEVVIETLRATTTSTGLTVNAMLDTTTYERGIKITDKQIAALEATQLHRHQFHGDWNYTLTADPTATRPTTPT